MQKIKTTYPISNIFLQIILFTFFLSQTCCKNKKSNNLINEETVEKTITLVKAPDFDDFRVLKIINQGISIEIKAYVAGSLEVLTAIDETMAEITSKTPHVYCMLPTGEQTFKINFNPSTASLGTQRIFFIEPNQNNILIEIKSEANALTFQKTVRENIIFEQLAETATDANIRSKDSLYENDYTDLEEISPENEEQKNESVEEIAVGSNKEKRSISIKTKSLYFDLNNYKIPKAELWVKDKSNSDPNTIKMIAKYDNFVEMVVLNNEIYTLDKKNKFVFLEEMYQKFKNDPAYSETKKHKQGNYTVLRNKNCSMISSKIGKMKVYCFTPYYKGNFHVILAFSSDIEERRISLNLEDFLKDISVR